MEISTDELRLNFDRVLHNLRKGIPMTLTYKHKQIDQIVPVES
jgi:antitoxin (DNA-binding transcriptional repressor) of toxin-antitoxin stability system